MAGQLYQPTFRYGGIANPDITPGAKMILEGLQTPNRMIDKANKEEDRQNLLKQQALQNQMAREGMDLRKQGMLLQEQEALRKAEQDENMMLLRSAQMGQQSDYQQAMLDKQAAAQIEQTKQNQFIRDQAETRRLKEEANTQLFKDLGSIRKTGTRAEIRGEDSPLSRFYGRMEDMTPEESAALPENNNLNALYEQAKARDSEIIKNPNEATQIADILAQSNADVATRSTLAKMLQASKSTSPEQEFRAEVIKKYGVDPTTKEGSDFVEAIRKKAAEPRKKSSYKSDSEYLIKELAPLTATDDPEESNRKLIEGLPDLQAYAKREGISFREAVERLKVATAENQGLVSIWDQDVERGLQVLTGKNY